MSMDSLVAEARALPSVEAVMAFIAEHAEDLRTERVAVALLDSVSDLCDGRPEVLEALEEKNLPAFWQFFSSSAVLARLETDSKVGEAASRISELCGENVGTLASLAPEAAHFWSNLQAVVVAHQASNSRVSSADLARAVCRVCKFLCRSGPQPDTQNDNNLDSLNTHGACAAVVTAMASHAAADASVAEFGCWAISVLAQDSPRFDHFPKALKVGDVVRRGPDWQWRDQDVNSRFGAPRVQCAGVVLSSAREGTSYSVGWRTDFAVASSQFSSNSYVYGNGRHDLFLVDTSDPSAVPAGLPEGGVSRPSPRGVLVAAGACAQVLNALKAHEVAGVAMWGLMAVYNLGMDDGKGMESLVAASASEVVYKAFKAHPNNPRVAEMGCTAFRGLADVSGQQDVLLQLGACKLVAEALAAHKSDAEVADWGCAAVSQLALNRDCGKALGEAGACDAVIGVLNAHSASHVVATEACIALLNLASSNGPERLTATAREAVIAAITTHCPVPAAAEGDSAEDDESEEGYDDDESQPAFSFASPFGLPAPPFGFSAPPASSSMLAGSEPKTAESSEKESECLMASALLQAALGAIALIPNGHGLVSMVHGNNCRTCNMGGPSPQSSDMWCSRCRQCAVCLAKNKKCTSPEGAVIPSTHVVVRKGENNHNLDVCNSCKQRLGHSKTSEHYCSACKACSVCCSKVANCAAIVTPSEGECHQASWALLFLARLAGSKCKELSGAFNIAAYATRLHINSAEVAEQGCLCLIALCRATPDKNAGPEVVAKALSLHSANAAVVLAACRAIGVFTRGSRSVVSTDISDDSDAATVIAASKVRSSDSNVTAACADIIAKLGAAGACEAVVDVLKAHSADSAVIEAACEALESLATFNLDNLVRIGTAGAVPLLMSALSTHPASVLGALQRLAFFGDNLTELKSLGALEACIGLLGRGKGYDVRVRVLAVCALRSFGAEVSATSLEGANDAETDTPPSAAGGAMTLRSYSNLRGKESMCFCHDPDRLVGSTTPLETRVEDLRLGTEKYFLNSLQIQNAH